MPQIAERPGPNPEAKGRPSPSVAPNLRAGVCVGAAIFDRETLLLLRRVDDFAGLWELPGGSVEVGERLDQALRREVREETGLAVDIGAPFHASTFESTGPGGTPVTVVAIEFLCSVRNGATGVRLSPGEHDGYAWVRADRLDDYPLVPDFRPVLPEAFRAHREARRSPAERRGR